MVVINHNLAPYIHTLHTLCTVPHMMQCHTSLYHVSCLFLLIFARDTKTIGLSEKPYFLRDLLS